MHTYRSTKSIKPGECFDYWRMVTCDTYVRVDCEPLESVHAGFTAQVEEQCLGAIKVSRHSLSVPMRYTRTHQDFELDNRSDYQFVLICSGKAIVHQNGRETLVKAGNMVLYEASTPFTLEYVTAHESITFKIPQSAIQSSIKHPSSLTARAVNGGQGMGLLAASAMKDIRNVGDFCQAKEHRASSAVLELIAATIDVELQPPPEMSIRHELLLGSIKRYLMENLEDTHITIEKIASRHNLTPRTVNRLFAQTGTTAIRWLWHQRLIASHRALSSGKASLVSEVALSYGFSDFSHFSRTFKKTFGICPNTLLGRR